MGDIGAAIVHAGVGERRARAGPGTEGAPSQLHG
jgi:hypothetical protein